MPLHPQQRINRFEKKLLCLSSDNSCHYILRFDVPGLPKKLPSCIKSVPLGITLPSTVSNLIYRKILYRN